MASTLGMLIAVGGYTFIYAKGYSYLTNDPAACANCHVMEDHYRAWMKSSHRAVAVCNDCHTPPGLVPKYTTKAINGFNHSLAFTTGRFPEPLRITPRNTGVTEKACRKCHEDMVTMIEGPDPETNRLISDHHVRSPVLNINHACQTCHKWPEAELTARVETIQARVFGLRNRSMEAVVALIGDIKEARGRGASDRGLDVPRKLQRRAQFLLDFVEAENSTGFHAPGEAARLLAESIDYARQGQLALRGATVPGLLTSQAVRPVAPQAPAKGR